MERALHTVEAEAAGGSEIERKGVRMQGTHWAEMKARRRGRPRRRVAQRKAPRKRARGTISIRSDTRRKCKVSTCDVDTKSSTFSENNNTR